MRSLGARGTGALQVFVPWPPSLPVRTSWGAGPRGAAHPSHQGVLRHPGGLQVFPGARLFLALSQPYSVHLKPGNSKVIHYWLRKALPIWSVKVPPRLLPPGLQEELRPTGASTLPGRAARAHVHSRANLESHTRES